VAKPNTTVFPPAPAPVAKEVMKSKLPPPTVGLIPPKVEPSTEIVDGKQQTVYRYKADKTARSNSTTTWQSP